MLKQQVLAACRHLLAPLVRWLLRSGVTWAEFAELSKEVYVEVARRDYGIQGRPTNNSRVAMITGLSRREVTRVRDVLIGEAPAPEPAASRVSQVLSGWHLDPEFLDAAGAPAVLPAVGESHSLEALLQRYAGDLPHGAFIKELQQLGLIVPVGTDAFRVLARDYVRSASDPDIVRQYGIALHDHAATLTHNVDAERAEPSRFEGMATTSRLAPRYVRAFAEHAAERSRAFLEEIDAWLVRHEAKTADADAEAEADDDADRGGVRMGIGVYLIQNAVRRGRKK
jgi:Family of unknown function (DUF6502)